MKSIHAMIAALGLAFVLPAAADAAQTDPEVIIYRFPGVRDDGGVASAGVATIFQCTNFSGQPENIRFATRGPDGTLATNLATTIVHLQTLTAVTHGVIGFFIFNLGTGPVAGGTTAIAATSINIICTATAIDAANPKPSGVALRGIRFSPVPGSEE